MCKYDVVLKTGNTQLIATPPEEDRVTTIGGNMQKIFGEDRTCSSENIIFRQTRLWGDREFHDWPVTKGKIKVR